MTSAKRITSFLLLLILAVCAIKPLFHLGQVQSCDEFAHIHFHKFFKTNTLAFKQIDNDNDCHEGKVLSGLVVLELLPVIELPVQHSPEKHSIVFNLVIYYPDPDIEPQRKPPRFA